MTNSQPADGFDVTKDLQPPPGQQAASSWEKSCPEELEKSDAPPPVWTLFIDQQVKENCTQ